MSSIPAVLLTLFLSTSLLDPVEIDINSAGEEDLLSLPGIGPARASAIIGFRERYGSFTELGDLLLVPGIGPSILEDIEGLVTLGGATGLPVDTQHWLPVEELTDTLLTLVFLDVGCGDAVLIEAAGGDTWLLDGGPDPGGPLVSPAAARLLQLGIEELDAVAFSHPHADHIGGLADVMRTFEVGLVLDPGMEFASFVYEEFLLEVLESGADYGVMQTGEVRFLSDHVSAEVVCIESDPDAVQTLNECSAVLLITCGSFSAFFGGDIEDDTERLLTGSLSPVTLMLAPHHGSRTSAFPPFVRSLRPQLAVFSAGRDNPFGHPHPGVVEFYAGLGAEILLTGMPGAIVVHTDGSRIQYSTSMRGTSP